MEYRVHTKDGKTYSYNEPSYGFDKFFIFFGIITSLIALGFYFTPGDKATTNIIGDSGLLAYSIFMFLASIYEIHKLRYNYKWRNKTKIIQLKNGKFMVYQYMRYRTGCDWEFGDVFCDWGWKPYGCCEMIEEDADLVLKKGLHFFDTTDEARALQKKIDELYAQREREIIEKKMEEDGVIPAREVK